MEIKITGAGRGTYWYAGFIGQTFEVVRDANDERGYQVIHYDPRDVKETKYYVGKEDCVVVSEVPANITVLKDESLGGVEREYREVKRKAGVGERIKVTGSLSGFYEDGDIGVVTEFDGDDDAWADFENGEQACIGKPDGYDGYFTLEPSDIIRVNGTRFRMVDRKAAVGERVIIIDAKTATDAYRNGDTMTVDRLGYAKDGVYTEETWVFVYRREYRVLEPVESAPVSEPLSAKTAPDQAAEIIAKLTTRVASLERRVTMLEVANAKPIPRRTAKPAPHPSSTKCAIKSPQEIRDDIVKRAKEDVAKLSVSRVDNVPTIGGNRAIFRMGLFLDTVRFEVNAEKRTVVALLLTHDGYVWARGIAKCAPGDVFNSHIGRAIALRRALGLEIPEEYVSAPQPTEVRVGDVVKYSGRNAPRVATVVADGRFTNLDTRRFTYLSTAISCDAIVIDDSREDSAEPRKEVA